MNAFGVFLRVFVLSLLRGVKFDYRVLSWVLLFPLLLE